ncbi:hypothetical protein BOTBODRAFT_42216 [Botryobasidium botryosum FD-172 SS1]|uniref:Uncharacterized protein n=1 Tax=Botryobasidium botryosum (strain FD-172 SS1) TaxID=930990 RepID=A0A067MV22_BOTB1|nr:hypothetical protein BOTBODRAFT_42216 [Botryobasidium botryosum FD-172 SS1]
MLATTIFADRPLAAEHKAELERIGAVVEPWLSAVKDNRDGVPGAKDRLAQADQDLTAFEVASEYAFAPAPAQPFRRLILSITRCYWMAATQSLSSDERSSLIEALNLIEGPFAQVDGEHLVENARTLQALEYVHLVQLASMALVGVSEKMSEWWVGLSVLRAHKWEKA